MRLLLQKHYVFDMEHGFVAKALTWSGAKRKLKKYKKETENHGDICIVTRYGGERKASD